MIIDKNNPDYKNEVQELIWNIATSLVPLDITLPMVPEELREPCIDLYKFSIILLEDMYQDAGAYGITSTENGAVVFYFWYFVWMYKKFRFFDDSFVTTKDEYEKFINSKFMNDYKVRQSVDIMLVRHDFKIEQEEDCIYISNNRYPGMIRAIVEVLDAAYQNYNVNCTEYLLCCDFRALVNYKRTYSDVFINLNDAGKAMAMQLEEFAAKIKVRPTKCTYYNRVEFKKKNKIVFILDVAKQKNLKINVGFANIDSNAFKMIEYEIEKYEDADDFKKFWHKYSSKKCQNCKSICQYKSNPIEVFGKKTIICGGIPFIRIYSPSAIDLSYLYRLIELRTMLVDKGISESFYPGNG